MTWLSSTDRLPSLGGSIENLDGTLSGAIGRLKLILKASDAPTTVVDPEVCVRRGEVQTNRRTSPVMKPAMAITSSRCRFFSDPIGTTITYIKRCNQWKEIAPYQKAKLIIKE